MTLIAADGSCKNRELTIDFVSIEIIGDLDKCGFTLMGGAQP